MSFPRFPDFPAEIQACIWDFVAQQPAIHFFESVRGPNLSVAENGMTRLRAYRLRFDRRSGYYQRIDLGRTCWGLRHTIARFRRTITEPWIEPDSDGRERQLLIDSDVDVICLKSRGLNGPPPDYLRPSSSRDRVRNLALEYPGELFSTEQRRCPFCRNIVSRTVECHLIRTLVTTHPNLQKLYLLVDGLPQPTDTASVSPQRLLRYGTAVPPMGQPEVFAAKGGVYGEAISHVSSSEISNDLAGILPLYREERAASERRQYDIREQADHMFSTLFSTVNRTAEPKAHEDAHLREAGGLTLGDEQREDSKEQTRGIEFRVLAGESMSWPS